MGCKKKESVTAKKMMIKSYKGLIKEYKQHKDYYIDLMAAFEKLIAIHLFKLCQS